MMAWIANWGCLKAAVGSRRVRTKESESAPCRSLKGTNAVGLASHVTADSVNKRTKITTAFPGVEFLLLLDSNLIRFDSPRFASRQSDTTYHICTCCSIIYDSYPASSTLQPPIQDQGRTWLPEGLAQRKALVRPLGSLAGKQRARH